MARKEIGTGWNRDNRNAMNDNFKELYAQKQIADNAEAAAKDAKSAASAAVTTAEQALSQSQDTQAQLDQIVIEGDSSVEAAQARVDEDGTAHSTLKARLDSGFTEVNQQLADTNASIGTRASQFDLQTQSARIDTLIAHAGDTDGNAELLDIRIGFDGNVYPTAGEAVRAFGNFLTVENEPWGGL